MSYSYDEPEEGIDYIVCTACDGTGGDCVMGECWDCNGQGTIWHGVPWEYRDFMQEQQERDRAAAAAKDAAGLSSILSGAGSKPRRRI